MNTEKVSNSRLRQPLPKAGLNECTLLIAEVRVLCSHSEALHEVKSLHFKARTLSHYRRVRPNPSFEARPNGKPPGPAPGEAYYPSAGPGVLPSVPPQLER